MLHTENRKGRTQQLGEGRDRNLFQSPQAALLLVSCQSRAAKDRQNSQDILNRHPSYEYVAVKVCLVVPFVASLLVTALRVLGSISEILN